MADQVTNGLTQAVSAFGVACADKLSGPGEREALIRAPIDNLITSIGAALGHHTVFHDEVRDTERQVRPDYAVRVDGAMNGYVEVKAPGTNLAPGSFTGHNKTQWERQQDLPNLVYTNGTEWRFYRDGAPHGDPVTFTGGPLDTAGANLTAPPAFEKMLRDFLDWKPAPITSVSALVRAIAPLTRLLRGEVLDQLAAETRAIEMGEDADSQPFTGLSSDWRTLLFPDAEPHLFADGYAQTVVFALLLARTEGIDLTATSLHDVGAKLGKTHSLMGRALQLLTDTTVATDFRVTLDLLVRVIGQVDWTKVRGGKRDRYLHLYEHFLEEYDHELRKESGSYYTPYQLVSEMVRLAEDALRDHLGKADGFRDPSVVTVDPAMGTGTFLHAILERVAEQATATLGAGLRGPAVTSAAKNLVGFELQMGPYAVAELRTADLLADLGANPPAGGMRLFVTDTLDDPTGTAAQLGSNLQPIAKSRKAANKVKASENVTVVIGNPPYRQLADNIGGWVERGSPAHGKRARGILEDFYDDTVSRTKAKLKNLYVYFWRWATWKVWESTQAGDAGVVCFITTSGYVTSPAFKGMRRYLREFASDGWIIDVTPEGQTPPIPTRLFPKVRQPLAIGLFVRKPGTDRATPAHIRWREVTGSQGDKLDALTKIKLDDPEWLPARTDWTAPLTPEATTPWDTYPAISDLMPWGSPGVFPTRTWVYAPHQSILTQRWKLLTSETDPKRKGELFKEGRDANLTFKRTPLPGHDTHHATTVEVGKDVPANAPSPVRVAYRAFDRQWVLPDSRLMDMPRRTLWAVRHHPDQVYVIEQHTKASRPGPGLLFTDLIPDFDHFKGSEGGRAMPLFHADGSANLATGLTNALSAKLGAPVSARDFLAYVAGITGHPDFTEKFRDELRTPGIRVPITADRATWDDVVNVGTNVLWVSTFGNRYVDAAAGRPRGAVHFPAGDPRQPKMHKPITEFPTNISHDPTRSVLVVGDGEFGPVPTAVWEYTVGGRPVLAGWFNYRQKTPGGKRTSDLDHVHMAQWPAEWSIELLDLITVLTRLVDLAAEQGTLLDRVLTGPVMDVDEFAHAGVRWPQLSADRRARGAVGLGDDQKS